MSEKRLYKERCIEGLDEAGNYYVDHVSALTREGLHSKSAIAAELAHRDFIIDELNSEAKQLNKYKDVVFKYIDRMGDPIDDKKYMETLLKGFCAEIMPTIIQSINSNAK